eukprot:CFRG5841T1
MGTVHTDEVTKYGMKRQRLWAFLEGVDLTLSEGLPAVTRNIFIREALKCGARVSVGYIHGKTTHVVCRARAICEETHCNVRNTALLNPGCFWVQAEWLSDCFRQHAHMPEETYIIPDQIDYGAMEDQCKNPLLLPQFECQRRVRLDDTLNSDLASLFKQVAQYYELMKPALPTQDQVKSITYFHAASSLYSCPFKITLANVHEIEKGLPNISKKLVEKIKLYLDTGHIASFDEKLNDEKYKIVQRFSRILYAGSSVCLQWYEKQYRTLEDVLKGEGDQLTANQKLGIEHYDDFQQMITEKERHVFEEIVMDVLSTCKYNPKWVICGSVRRGKRETKDIDMLFHHEKDMFELNDLVEPLKQRGIITHICTESKREIKEKSGIRQALIVIKLPGGCHHRVDLILSPENIWAHTLFSWTGSKLFIRSTNMWAKSKNMKLGRTCIKRLDKDNNTIEEVVAKTEDEIFKVLGLEYILPEERNC